AQLRIIELLTDNPVNEGRPNVMAVGDDDQAIYAFQGADHANMYSFSRMYKDVRLISLRENYRSHRDILDVAYNLGSQIEERLHEQFNGVSKILKQASDELPEQATVAHYEFISDAAQYAWVAEQVKQLVTKKRIAPEEIAILAPKHRYLIPILPFLANRGLPVRYEKRENVLDKPIVHVLEQMSRLVLALTKPDQSSASALWPEILSYDFFGLSTEEIWDISWKSYKAGTGWTETLLKDAKTKPIAEFFLRLKDLLPLTTLEQQLDFLVGVTKSDAAEHKLPMRSPFFEFYFGAKKKDTVYLELLSDLAVLRGRLRAWRRQELKPFGLADFIGFIDAHRVAELNVLNTSPHYESKSAVNVMTAYQAKGREFKAVFILAALDEVWGSASRDASSNISLPPNLRFIRYRGASDDERLRLLYVAITRAKSYLYLTSYAATLDGRTTRPLKYLAGQEVLQTITAQPEQQPLLDTDLQNYWHLRHVPPFKPKLEDLLEPTLAAYQLSPTHLNQFTDVERGGPEQFFLNTILRFPKAQTPSAQYGTVIHEVIKWIHDVKARTSKMPSIKQVLDFFESRLKLQRLAELDYQLLLERGHEALRAYTAQAAEGISASDVLEHNFRSEGVFVNQARLTGKVDKLVINKNNKTITVIDFKTGRGYDGWRNNVVTLHKYRQQLLIYKLLVEGSHSYAGYRVDRGVLQFVEPNAAGKILELELTFDESEMDTLKKLISAVWRHILKLDFPDTSKYPATLGGIKAFEADLIK
ncbi:MAG TPA: ATP-dependent DNA helicase, partial [Candidatus Binatia bacterium]|nr:ATP-dependent DNA helicase [Candidatus Binatia bacterium]